MLVFGLELPLSRAYTCSRFFEGCGQAIKRISIKALNVFTSEKPKRFSEPLRIRRMGSVDW